MTPVDANDTGHVLTRRAEIVWRTGPDRVLLHRCAPHSQASTELHGAAAFAWLALDEPATAADVLSRIEEVDMSHDELTDDVVMAALNDLVTADLVAVSSGGSVPP